MELYKFEWRKLENLAKQYYIYTTSVKKEAQHESTMGKPIQYCKVKIKRARMLKKKKKHKLGGNGNSAGGLHRTFWNILRTLWVKTNFVELSLRSC